MERAKVKRAREKAKARARARAVWLMMEVTEEIQMGGMKKPKDLWLTSITDPTQLIPRYPKSSLWD